MQGIFHPCSRWVMDTVTAQNWLRTKVFQEKMTTEIADWIMTEVKLLHLSYLHLLIFIIFFNLCNIKALLQDSKGDSHSLFLCGVFIWLFSLEVCPVSFIFTWCFCRVTGQGNHSSKHWVTWSVQTSNLSSSVTPALPETTSACFWKEIQLVGWITFRNACLASICNILSYGEKSKDLRAPDPGLHQQEPAPDLVLFF